MVNIIAHRGFWKTEKEQNTLVAFERAFDAGFGVELDVRDSLGSLVVSHDPPPRPSGGNEFLLFSNVLDLLGDRPNTLAVNVKSCGLAPWFAKLKAPKDWFFFDMAVADEEDYRRNCLPIFLVDRWGSEPSVILSSELFGSQSIESRWKLVKLESDSGHEVYLITDYPDKAKEFFK